jgi:hypothetical protein
LHDLDQPNKTTEPDAKSVKSLPDKKKPPKLAGKQASGSQKKKQQKENVNP